MKAYFFRHLQVLFDTLGRMARAPLPTTMTAMVLGIAIALPMLLFKVAQSMETVGSEWKERPQLSLFLQVKESDPEHLGMELGEQLLQSEMIVDVEYISPIEALIEFKRTSGFGDILNDLPNNPLPPVLIVYPGEDVNKEQLDNLAEELSALPGIENVSYDQAWIQRLSALIKLFKRGLLVLAVLMGIGVVLIISNTVRLGIINRSDEIEIIDQIGGTHAFIRRPFLYFGIMQGVVGAFFAFIITNTAILAISYPISQLAELYDSDFRIEWVEFSLAAAVFMIAGLLGWVAARVAVDSYLKRLRISGL